jgi:two-component system LytT family response regulator
VSEEPEAAEPPEPPEPAPGTATGRSAAVRPLRVLVADDEAVARRRLLRLLAAMPDVTVAGECQDGHEVLERARSGAVDVVLLDIQMPELSGLDALQLLPADGPTVIFCTAHTTHAIAAFDVGAIDYLLKPVEAARLRKALARAREHEARRRYQDELARHQSQSRAPAAAPPLLRLALPTRLGIVLIDPQHISHARLEGELVTVYTSKGEHLSDLSLQELEGRLPTDSFVRVHRRALVNLEHVVRLDTTEIGGFIAWTGGGHAVEVSRQAARQLRRRLGLR